MKRDRPCRNGTRSTIGERHAHTPKPGDRGLYHTRNSGKKGQGTPKSVWGNQGDATEVMMLHLRGERGGVQGGTLAGNSMQSDNDNL